MSTPKAATMTWYGAFELKRFYQRNMAAGVLIASAFHLAIIGGVLFYQWWKERKVDYSDVPVVRISTLADIAPPPSMTHQKPQITSE